MSIAHWPASGVKVYVVVDVLFMIGDQVPEIPLLLLFGRLNESPLQMSCIGVKLGVICEEF